MDIWAIVPVKSMHESKRRLAHMLSSAERAVLIGDLLTHVLAILNQVPNIRQILVVSSDPQIWDLVRLDGAQVLEEPAADGLNVAVRRGMDVAVKNGATAVLILPVDLPFISAAAVESLLASVILDDHEQLDLVKVNGSRQEENISQIMAICSDQKGEGTNAMFLPTGTAFSFHYGPGSYKLHVEEGKKRGLALKKLSIPELQFDLDTENDWLLYRSSKILDC